MQDREIGSALGDAHEHPEAIELVRRGKVNLEPFITNRIRADEIVEQGLEQLIRNKDSEVKILVSMK